MSGRETTVRIVPPDDVGARYAAASGDDNPIHVDPAAARAAGLPGPILHGMWTLATAVATLAGDPFALRELSVELRGIGLPGAPVDVTSRTSGEGREVAFSALQDGRALLRDGRATLRPRP